MKKEEFKRTIVFEVVQRYEMEITDEALQPQEVAGELGEAMINGGSIIKEGVTLTSDDVDVRGSFQTIAEGGEYPMIEEHTSFTSILSEGGEWAGFDCWPKISTRKGSK